MGKRKWRSKKGTDEPKKAKGDVWVQDQLGGKVSTWKEPSYTNALLEKFYAANVHVVPPQEYDTFLAACRRPLPAAFRISAQQMDVAEYLVEQMRTVWVARLTELARSQAPGASDEAPVEAEDEDDTATAEQCVIEEEQIVPPKPIAWYPGDDLAWRVTMPRHVLRKSTQLKDFNRMLVAEHALGGLARQEEVSMIPPTLLDIQPDSTVLDMCAAPGSKTIQLLEMLVGVARQKDQPVTGCVVANDVNFKRAEVLVTQTQKLAGLLAQLIIVNHDARNFPRLETEDGQHWGFDRVLCDVMCSGDGTLRKSPDKWESWGPRESSSLHRMQIQVLERAMYLCNVGGRIVYSTCSMNPVEDEAVLLECLKKGHGCFNLIDVSAALPGLQRSPGILDWVVMTKAGLLCSKWEELPENERSIVLRSCFPPDMSTEQQRGAVEGLHIERAMRILPHQQDTGGFFVAVLHKTAHWNPEMKDHPGRKAPTTSATTTHAPAPMPDCHTSSVPETTVPPSNEAAIPPEPEQTTGRAGNKKLTDRIIPIDDTIKQQLQFQLQLHDEFPMHLVHRREQNIGVYKKKLFWISETSRRMLKCMNCRGKFAMVSAGLRLFEELTIKGKMDHWRLAHEGLSVILPYLPNHRIIPISFTDAAALIRSPEGKRQIGDFEEQTRAAVRDLLAHGGGSCALHCANASPALKGGLYLSGYCNGGVLLLYLSKVDTENVLYRMGLSQGTNRTAPVSDVNEVTEEH